MPAGYAPVPNPSVDPDAENEMDAAFGLSDDDDDYDDDNDDGDLESHPLRGHRRLRSRSPSLERSNTNNAGPSTRSGSGSGSGSALPGSYDFENVGYDMPPPGSPPPAHQAFANDWGNSNGVVPGSSTSAVDTFRSHRGGWLGRTAAAILPAHYVSRIGMGARSSGPVGGGNQNDGVFANVTAKPVRGVQVRDGDETYIVPEETRVEQPPSYREAQADSVPTYWDATTVHVAGGSNIPGEVIVESLPTGSLFSFLWNALISVSFQFIGFLLTYLLHTTHAARLGSRAGLGITLIQFGFALRRSDFSDSRGGTGEDIEVKSTAHEQEEYMHSLNTTYPATATESTPVTVLGSEAGAEWMAFFLMTVGWFILLTSVLGFWRVKRWERSMLASPPGVSAPGPSARSRFDRIFDVPGLSALRQRSGHSQAGPGPQPSQQQNWLPTGLQLAALDSALEQLAQEEEGEHSPRRVMPGRTQFVIDDQDPERAQEQTRALVAEQRLNMDLRAAGLL